MSVTPTRWGNVDALLSEIIVMHVDCRRGCCLRPYAGPIVYTISGNGSGSLNGVSFVNADYSFQLTADTGDMSAQPPPSEFEIITSLHSVTFTIENVGSGTLLPQTEFGQFHAQVLFGLGPFGDDLIDFYLPSHIDMTQNHGPLTGTGVYDLGDFFNIGTTAGGLTLSQSSDVTFSSSTAVPEPASWALMLAGFGLVGSVLRKRPIAKLLRVRT